MKVRIATAATVAIALTAGPVTSPAAATAESPARYLDPVFSETDLNAGIRYGTASGPGGEPVELLLDLYQPRGDEARRRPAIIWIHGGGFGGGSRTDRNVVDASTSFARLGYVTLSIDYRLLADPPCGGTNVGSGCAVAANAATADARMAIRWLRARSRALRVDASRIAIGGFSAGAVMSLLVGTNAAEPAPSGVRAVVSSCGGLPTNASVTRGDTPTIFFHGTADRVVPYEWALSNHNAMRAAGIPSAFHPIEGAGHCPSWWDGYRDRMIGATKRFLRRHLGLAPRRIARSR